MLHVLLSILVAAALPAGASYGTAGETSTVHYKIVHKLHEVEAITHDVEARVVVKEDGTVLTMVRVPVASFRSGDANRDAHMLEAVEAGKFPFVVFKGIAQLGTSRDLPSTPVNVRGEVDFHGMRTPLDVPVEISTGPDGSLRARGGFDVCLDAHRVDRPSLLFVKIDDACRITFDLSLRGSR